MGYEFGFLSLLFSSIVIVFFVVKISTLPTLTAWLYTFPIVLSSYYIIYQSWIYPFYISSLRSVPTVPGFPLWGQTFTVITEEVGVPQRRWHKQHGPILRYFLPFGRVRLSIIDDDALKQITVKHPYRWAKPAVTKNFMEPMLGKGVLLAEGDAHAQQRKALAPAFSTSSIKALSPIFWRKALLMSDLWRAEMSAKDKQTSSIEVLQWLDRATLDIIAEAGFGANFDSLNNPETPIRRAYDRWFNFDNWEQFLHGLRSQTSWARYLPLKTNRELHTARDTVVSIASEIIHDKQTKKFSNTLSREKDIIALLVRDNSTASGNLDGHMTFETMRDQVMTFLGAGHDTTAVAVAWTLHLIAKHPCTQDKLRREIHEYMPSLFSPDTRSDASCLATIDEDRLPYLNNVCRESLRYIPSVPITVRQNNAEEVLCGYRIPAQTTVTIHSNTINRAPHFWGEDADVFDPERWDRLPKTFTPNAYMTFQQGPRGCIGKKFAETEMKTLLCCLLSMYRFEQDEGVDDPEQWKMWRVTLRPRSGVHLRVIPLA